MVNNHYLALLRGINVGGKNIIKMSDLKACFESLGFTDVVTYIQSGNVFFKSTAKDKTKLIKTLEKALSERFNYESRLLVIDFRQLQNIIVEANPAFGKESDMYKYDVVFLLSSLASEEAIEKVKVKDCVDHVYAGNGVLYFSRLISKASQSRLSKIMMLPMYQHLTIRNWNTTSKLYEMMKGERCI